MNYCILQILNLQDHLKIIVIMLNDNWLNWHYENVQMSNSLTYRMWMILFSDCIIRWWPFTQDSPCRSVEVRGRLAVSSPGLTARLKAFYINWWQAAILSPQSLLLLGLCVYIIHVGLLFQHFNFGSDLIVHRSFHWMLSSEISSLYQPLYTSVLQYIQYSLNTKQSMCHFVTDLMHHFEMT